ncbi:MAG TPA: dUTP diphosphatase [Allosphingosinicella sp.]|nr:dUTP diphosphatase [Allosphingosinicella sp.]
MRSAEIRIELKRLPHGEGLPMPAYGSEHAVGLDAIAAEDVTLPPGARHPVKTGIALAIPHGYEVQVRSRSGTAVRNGITCLTGTIDADYRGEIMVVLVNLGQEPFEIRRGDRIAQLVPAPVLRAAFVEVEALDETARGEGGFGSTGR